jgi:hypothetical protein
VDCGGVNLVKRATRNDNSERFGVAAKKRRAVNQSAITAIQ